MADTYSGKLITDLTENSSGNDTDLVVVGNQGTSTMRRLTLANIATYVRDKLSSLTYTLSTTAQTLPGAINELYASLVARTNVTVTVGNGTVMTLGTNTSHIKGSEMYINCSISFSGSRSSGTMLARMSTTVPSTQYLTVYKNGSAAYLTNIAAGTGDIACPVAFASGDIAYIVGVVSIN